MYQKFADILDAQETEDLSDTLKEDRLMTLLRQEFANADKILQYMSAHPDIKPCQFFDEKGIRYQLDFVPERQVSHFKMRKHNHEQRPYFHSHTFYEIVYVCSGSSVQTLQNKPAITLKKGQAALLCPGVAHSMSRAKLYDVVFKMHIPADLFLQACTMSNSPQYEGLNIFSSLPADFESIALKLLDEYQLGDTYSDNAILHCLSLLLIALVRNRTSGQYEMIMKLEDYLKNNLRDATLSTFAKQQGYSVVYVGRLIKKYAKKSFSDIHLEAKLKKAAALLAETDLPLEEIAFQTGYSNTSGLHKQFYRYYGTSPGTYRKRFL